MAKTVWVVCEYTYIGLEIVGVYDSAECVKLNHPSVVWGPVQLKEEVIPMMLGKLGDHEWETVQWRIHEEWERTGQPPREEET